MRSDGATLSSQRNPSVARAPAAAMGLLARAAALALVAATGGLATNSLRSDGVPLGRFEPPAMCDGGEGHDAPVEIEPRAAAELCGQPGVVIADARPAARYTEGHIAGAIHLPCDATGRVASDAFAHLDGTRTIIVYGQSTDEARPVAASLRRRYRADVRVLKGGFAGWDRAGLACASGPCDDCKEHGR
jgi:rhodanese-related sulfurtransferase